MKNTVPDLGPHEGSWIVRDRSSGQAVLETYSRAVAECINQDKYEVLTAGQHLARLNAEIAAAQTT